MFITSTRIVGLIAVVCALIVAPQALAASSTHSRIAPPGDEPSGFNLGELKNRRAVLTAATHQSLKVAMFVYMPTNPGWGAAATEAKKSASKPALAPVVKTAPVVCLGHAEYDYVDLGCEWWS